LVQTKCTSRKTVVGVVASDRMQKTIAVEVERLVKVPKYGKYVRRRSLFLAHDEKGEAHPGDKVEIQECRRLSKRKSWRLVRVLQKV